MANLIGKYRYMAVDKKTHEALITFAVRSNLGALENKLGAYGEKDLFIKLSLYSPKRSLNANSYFHALCREIGYALDRSEIWVKNRLIAEYGQIEVVDNGDYASMKANIDCEKMWQQEWLHVRPCGVKIENGKEVFFYRIMRASHTYTVSEMSQLINGTVQEAKELGIPTISDAEMERLLDAWGK